MEKIGSRLGRPRKIYQSFVYRKGTYSEEGIPCRHPECTSCPHGHYWYLRIIIKDRKETFYLGGRLQIVSWEAEGLGGLTFEELFRRRKQRAAEKRERELKKALDK